MIKAIWWVATAIALVGLGVMAYYAVPMLLAGSELPLRNERLMGAGIAFMYSAPGWLSLFALGIASNNLRPQQRRAGLALGVTVVVLYAAAHLTALALGPNT